jgi:hypothetical protein
LTKLGLDRAYAHQVKDVTLFHVCARCPFVQSVRDPRAELTKPEVWLVFSFIGVCACVVVEGVVAMLLNNRQLSFQHAYGSQLTSSDITKATLGLAFPPDASEIPVHLL